MELRNGYRTPLDIDKDGTSFISQRNRLNFYSSSKKYSLMLRAQNFLVWGGNDGITESSNEEISFHEAWIEFNINRKIKLKIGRQELVYDDSRILGNLDWSQKASSHDLFLLKMKLKSGIECHLGGALNSDSENDSEKPYKLDRYKYLQYLWLHKKDMKYYISLLFMNTGFSTSDNPNMEKINYSQTFGFHSHYFVNNDFFVNLSAYSQIGKDVKNHSIESYLLSLEARYKPNRNLGFKLGAQMITGNDSIIGVENTKSTNKAFNPYFGSNHEFYGHMDYFFNKNHYNSLGLYDYYIAVNFKRQKLNSELEIHFFHSFGKIKSYEGLYWANYNRELGYELDLSLKYNFNLKYSLNFGASWFFETTSFRKLKNIDFMDSYQSYYYVMLSLTPQFSFRKSNY
jgi:hypothetical protein